MIGLFSNSPLTLIPLDFANTWPPLVIVATLLAFFTFMYQPWKWFNRDHDDD